MKQGKRVSLNVIRDYIAEHYHEPLSLDQLAGMAGLRPKYFGELFKKTFGQSLMDYLTGLRMGRAKQYLQESDYLLREIAHKVGYSDEFYFSRKFKKETGVAPSAFIRQPLRRIAACSAAAVGQLLALDIIPVAAPLDAKWTSYYYNKYYEAIEIHLRVDLMDQELERDKLIKSRTDAIIGHDAWDPQWEEHLLRNSQNLFIPREEERWDEQLRAIAVFLGRELQLELWLQRFAARSALAREQVAAVAGEERCMVLRLYEGELHAYCNRGIRDVIFGELALRPAYTRGGPLYNEPVTLEEVRLLNPERLMLIICPDFTTRRHWLSLQHSGSWRSLSAVQAGKVDLLPSDPWFEYSAVALDRMLEEAVLMLTGNSPNPEQDTVHGYPAVYPL
ncbi:helix-turn-helix domain-containing protein [Paenibacillus sp. MMS20-IR301]|uniref:helix-turn-helix domain-containing protein n=1 Tax=Paenibacillus sp. MMS20-IR301 TaxID=2895946 RepID=UPI0028EA29BA|nr:helix-turn-helix domain-containing protein [Paenibacillus sp. MMS20-IR301]WNS44625.1 AraC family transcriptional regulator [Paenibacillus sp. MMS20-IR301]